MIENYWKIFYDLDVAVYYYQYYSIKASRQKRRISCICALASSAFAVSWLKFPTWHFFWAALVFISQLISVLQPFFPYEKQYHAACYIHQDLSQLFSEAEHIWRSIPENIDRHKIEDYTYSLKKKWDEIETRFASSDTFPPDNKLHNRAEESAETYFRRFEY